VTAEDVAAFRADRADDASLVGVVAWASYRAAQRTAEWLRVPTLQTAIPAKATAQ
jgi:hypothetical protein